MKFSRDLPWVWCRGVVPLAYLRLAAAILVACVIAAATRASAADSQSALLTFIQDDSVVVRSLDGRDVPYLRASSSKGWRTGYQRTGPVA